MEEYVGGGGRDFKVIICEASQKEVGPFFMGGIDPSGHHVQILF